MYNYQQNQQPNWDSQGWNNAGQSYGKPENAPASNTSNNGYNGYYGQSQENYSQPRYQAPQPTYYGYSQNYQYAYPVDRYGIPYSSRSWLVTLMFSIFLGWFGIDHFYTGHIGTGLLKLLTGGGCGIWWLIDIILVASGRFSDNEGRLVKVG